MGTYGKGMVPLSSQTTEDKRAYLDQRCERLNWTRSEAVTKLVDFWLAIGAPPLSELDALAPTIPIPQNAKEPLRPYWAHLVPFEADDAKGKPSAKDAAQHLLNRPRKGTRAKGRSDPSNHSSHTRT